MREGRREGEKEEGEGGREGAVKVLNFYPLTLCQPQSISLVETLSRNTRT